MRKVFLIFIATLTGSSLVNAATFEVARRACSQICKPGQIMQWPSIMQGLPMMQGLLHITQTKQSCDTYNNTYCCYGVTENNCNLNNGLDVLAKLFNYLYPGCKKYAGGGEFKDCT